MDVELRIPRTDPTGNHVRDRVYLYVEIRIRDTGRTAPGCTELLPCAEVGRLGVWHVTAEVRERRGYTPSLPLYTYTDYSHLPTRAPRTVHTAVGYEVPARSGRAVYEPSPEPGTHPRRNDPTA